MTREAKLLLLSCNGYCFHEALSNWPNPRGRCQHELLPLPLELLVPEHAACSSFFDFTSLLCRSASLVRLCIFASIRVRGAFSLLSTSAMLADLYDLCSPSPSIPRHSPWRPRYLSLLSGAASCFPESPLQSTSLAGMAKDRILLGLKHARQMIKAALLWVHTNESRYRASIYELLCSLRHRQEHQVRATVPKSESCTSFSSLVLHASCIDRQPERLIPHHRNEDF